jgi:hypothetical protein
MVHAPQAGTRQPHLVREGAFVVATDAFVGTRHAARRPPAVNDESTFCLQCWHVPSPAEPLLISRRPFHVSLGTSVQTGSSTRCRPPPRSEVTCHEWDGETNWTVLTVARNGNWGIGSARTQGEAIAGALGRCQAMTADESDCSAEFVAFRSGLALALMCGDHRVIVTASDSEEADSSALDRIVVLRELYGPDFPMCQHLLRIDSNGALTTFKAKRLEGGYALPTSSD